MRFRDFLMSEARVTGSAVAEAIRRTLEFKVDADWVSWDFEHPKARALAGLDSPLFHDPSKEFYVGARFRTTRVGAALFELRSTSVLSRPDLEYDSLEGGVDLVIVAELFLDGTLLSRRSHPRPSLSRTKMGVFDGPPLRTPLELAEWVGKVAGNADAGGEDGFGDGPEEPPLPTPRGGRLVGV